MQFTIKLRTIIGLALIAAAVYVQRANPSIHWPGIDWIVPSAAPIKEPGFRVLIVEETAERGKLPKGQWEQIMATAPGSVRDYCKSHCVKVGSDPEYRIVDKDVDASRESPIWQAALKRERKSVPWLIASNGKHGFEGPLPSTTAETIALLKRYGE